MRVWLSGRVLCIYEATGLIPSTAKKSKTSKRHHKKATLQFLKIISKEDEQLTIRTKLKELTTQTGESHKKLLINYEKTKDALL